MSTFWQQIVKVGVNSIHVFLQVSGNSLNLSLIDVLQLCEYKWDKHCWVNLIIQDRGLTYCILDVVNYQ